MTQFLIEYLNVAMTHIGSLFIVMFPMWNTRDRSRRFVFLCIGTFALLAGVGLFIFRGFTEIDIDFIHTYRTAIAIPSLTFAFFIFRKRVWQNIFLMSIAFLYAPITTGTGQYIGEVYFAENVMLATSIINTGVVAVTLPLLLFMLRRLCGNTNIKQAVMFWRFIWLVPAVFFAMILLTSSHFSLGFFSDNFIWVRVLTYVLLLLICYLFDIAVRQIASAEAAKRAAEEHEEKARFYRRMAHDILTPLTRVSTDVQMVKENPGIAEERLEETQSEIMGIAKMITDALNESGGRKNENRPVG